MSDSILKPEDYVEPRCLLCDEPFGAKPQVKAVPQQRIIQKMDEYMSHRDYEGAERHLLYWYEEARLGRDRKGQLMICNELTGHYRKIGDKDKAYERGEESLALLHELDMENSISAGTTCVNYATACSAFGDNDRAMELFTKAKEIYESSSTTRADLLGGLYNNMALTCVALKDFSGACELYEQALALMGNVDGGELEQAITYLNMANAVEDELGLEAGEKQINDYLDKAEELFNTPSLVRDGYYAFVCEKCFPTFQYYGYFLTAEELAARADKIYRENGQGQR